MIRPRWITLALAAATLSVAAAHGQALPAGIGPGTYVQLGASGSLFQMNYGQRKLGGGTLFMDAHLYRRIGSEAEVRTLQIHEDAGAHATTYLAGPRISVMHGAIRPYAKLLAGRGEFYFPFNYAKGSYMVLAAGGGVDWHVAKSRLTIRLIDVEFQDWPGFSYGAMHPYGVGAGVAWTVFSGALHRR